MSLQSPETQELKYKKRTIATFGFSLSPFCFKFKILLVIWLSPFFVITCSLTKSFPLKMTYLHYHFLLEYSSVFSYYTLDTTL